MLNFSWNHSKLIMQKIAKYNWHSKIDPESRLIRKLKRFGNRIGNVTKMVKINYRLLSFFNNQLLTAEFDEKVRKLFYTIKLFMGWAAGQHSCKNNNWTIRILFLTRRWQKNKGTPMCNLQTKMAKKSPRKMSNALDKVHFSAWPDATLLLTQIWLRLSNHYCMTGPFTHGTFQKSIVQQKVVHGTFLDFK